ncbi:hypothetical protein GOBAR_AA29676 [Gossypium barbadense]|uniref:Reverse transcriptase zinc-binding domain-containing protein n=1 Tax=Gossypium barbadense TaxID=3634 RepID=A0A2P5WIW4_GOSBA|nr:hypothetical protein GOBAR_DD15942 [Gossypium barbadense]PPR91015.1 hypothetical protein GOBAR_AA29675 [Gossypium barbadense]PPR91016.1 hypothetical protein GOBAR_AA29676 [Gossypium barbadense]
MENETSFPGGKLTLIKSTLSTWPVFQMSCFQAPVKVCETTDKAKRNFWWKHNEDKRKLRFVNWNYLCAPKFASGLGLCSFQHFNQALLARQAWRILMNEALLILHSGDLLIKGLDWCIGNVWRPNTSGIYTGKSGYNLIAHGNDLLNKPG